MTKLNPQKSKPKSRRKKIQILPQTDIPKPSLNTDPVAAINKEIEKQLRAFHDCQSRAGSAKIKRRIKALKEQVEEESIKTAKGTKSQTASLNVLYFSKRNSHVLKMNLEN